MNNPLFDFITQLGAVVTALGGIWAFARNKILRPLIKDEVSPLLNDVRQELIDEIREIRKEVGPNGGQSMYDAVKRIEKRQEQLAQQFTEHLLNHQNMGG